MRLLWMFHLLPVYVRNFKGSPGIDLSRADFTFDDAFKYCSSIVHYSINLLFVRCVPHLILQKHHCTRTAMSYALLCIAELHYRSLFNRSSVCEACSTLIVLWATTLPYPLCSLFNRLSMCKAHSTLVALWVLLPGR